MISFFRRIRQNSLNANKLSKYLLYALGEIALVVIGILLALQVNNWNTNNKNAQQVEIYLNDLKSDLNSDISKLNNLIATNEDKLAQIDTLWELYRNGFSFTRQGAGKFIARHISLTFETYFIAEESTINQIQASSHGSLIRNKSLKDNIFRYYTYNHRNEKNNEISIQLYQHHLITKAILGVLHIGEVMNAQIGDSLGLPKWDHKEALRNKEYHTALMLKRGNCQTQNEAYKALLQLASDLIEQIEKELNHP